MSKNNNGLNEFNKRQIDIRMRRLRKANVQRSAVLVVFLVLVALVITLAWLVILDLAKSLGAEKPEEDPKISLDSGDPIQSSDIPQSGTPESTTPESNDPGSDTESSETGKPTVGYDTVQKVYTKAQSQAGNLVLINADHPFIEETGFASKLSAIKGVRNNRPKIEVDGKANYSLYFTAQDVLFTASAIPYLLNMTDDCYRETKINDLCLSTSGAYRTFEDQKKLFESGTTTIAAGCSDFNAGLSVYIIGYPDAGKYPTLDDPTYASGQVLADWLDANAYKYGFIRRFTSDKSNITKQPGDVGHYRYVGVPHSDIIKKRNFCLEEYLNELKNHTFGKEHLTITASDGHTYEIYYVASEGDTTNVTVPASLPYTVSGDNQNGFIVTVKLD